MAVRLRVFDSEAPTADSPTPTVHIRLGDLLPLLSTAQRRGYLWLRDFIDDEVAITQDLYEILRTFGSYRPSA
jgi:hypothetical protein